MAGGPAEGAQPCWFSLLLAKLVRCLPIAALLIASIGYVLLLFLFFLLG